jgi:hypothetical protein
MSEVTVKRSTEGTADGSMSDRLADIIADAAGWLPDSMDDFRRAADAVRAAIHDDPTIVEFTEHGGQWICTSECWQTGGPHTTCTFKQSWRVPT